jgi:UDP-2,3-diacylglucosamine pyrophosphatase LpxH
VGKSKTKRGRSRSDVELVLVCSDVHVPYHDPFAWRAFLARLDDVQPDRLIINGDFADFLSVSLHEDGQPAPEFAAEVEAVRAQLYDLRRRMGNKPIHYVEGNHEHRYARYVAKKAPVLRGRETWQSALCLAEYRITSSDYGKVHKIGHLGITHGVYAGDAYAKQHLLRYGTSIVIGHCHRAQIHTIPVAGPEGSQHVRGGFGIPCLCPVDEAPYLKGPTGWTQGHGEFWIERVSGRFTADVVIYTEQRFWRDGKCYDGRA